MRRIAFSAIMIAIMAFLMESFSALFLFRYYAAVESSFFPAGLSTIYLAKKALKLPLFEVTRSIDKSPLYTVDDRLGYTTNPGRYRVGFSVGNQTHSFTITFVRPGTRATSYTEIQRPRSIIVFGDSVMLGWGNNDEQSMPWLLQQKFQNYNVINLAQTGYGITHAVIQYRLMTDAVTSNDLVILPYAHYYLVRNYGAPSWMQAITVGVEQDLTGKKWLADARYPVARAAANGGLSIEYIGLSCTGNKAYCAAPEPAASDMVAATNAIISFFSRAKAKVLFAYFDGPDGDPVVEHARTVGLKVVDIRLDKRGPEWSDLGRFDPHPGPTAQYNFFRKLSAFLVEHRLIVP
jgi:hypothetical protein